jgi:hypothetical protein
MNMFFASASFIYREFGLRIWILGWHMLRGRSAIREELSIFAGGLSIVSPLSNVVQEEMVLLVAQPAFPALQSMCLLPVQAKETIYMWVFDRLDKVKLF